MNRAGEGASSQSVGGGNIRSGQIITHSSTTMDDKRGGGVDTELGPDGVAGGWGKGNGGVVSFLNPVGKSTGGTTPHAHSVDGEATGKEVDTVGDPGRGGTGDVERSGGGVGGGGVGGGGVCSKNVQYTKVIGTRIKGEGGASTEVACVVELNLSVGTGRTGGTTTDTCPVDGEATGGDVDTRGGCACDSTGDVQTLSGQEAGEGACGVRVGGIVVIGYHA